MMNWPEAVDALLAGFLVRRANWPENAFVRDGGPLVLLSTPPGFFNPPRDCPADDWEILARVQ